MSDGSTPAGFPGSVDAVATVVSWVADSVESRAAEARLTSVPMLLSLPESNGEEIHEIVERGLVRKTESETAILDEDAGLIVALPRTMVHRSFLQHIIAGYKLVSDAQFAGLLEKAEAAPSGGSNTLCRSAFINFDRATFEVDVAGAVVEFSQIGRVCQLHTPQASEWAMCFWSDSEAVTRIAGASTAQVLDSVLVDAPALHLRVREWCRAIETLALADRDLVLNLTRSILCLGLALNDKGWRTTVSRVGLINRDTKDQTCFLLFLEFEIGVAESRQQIVEALIAQLEAQGLIDIHEDGHFVVI